MEKLLKHKYEITLFIVDAVGMILELCASRVLSPYFGSSNMVWTCVIAIILLSSSLGHFFGGKIADSPEPKKNLSILLVGASAFIMCIPLIADFVISSITNSIGSSRLGAIIATSIIFLCPSILLGAISPIVLKLNLNDLENAGKTAGRISAFSTLGGILGTVLGGFFLIPNFGTMNIIFLLAIIVVVARVISVWDLKDKLNIISLIVLLGSILGIIIYTNINNVSKEKVLNGEIGVNASFDTEYGRVLLYNIQSESDVARVCNINGGLETICFFDDEKKYLPFSEYARLYEKMFDINSNIKATLMIGGAGYSFPKRLISSRPNCTMDVVEIDNKITDIAYEYFSLKDLEEEFNLKENKRLNIIADDGRMYLNNNSKKYDAILNDAFSGEEPAKTLTTIEAVKRIKDSLNENGVYLTNVVSSISGKHSRFLYAEGNTIKQVFKHVYYIPVWYDDERNYDGVRNIMLIACDKKIDGINELLFDDKELVLTDDFCPIENMTYYREM